MNELSWALLKGLIPYFIVLLVIIYALVFFISWWY